MDSWPWFVNYRNKVLGVIKADQSLNFLFTIMEAGTHFAAKGCFIKSRYEIMQQIGLKFL